MKPRDANGRLPVSKRPFRVLVVSGSDRSHLNCSGVDSKSSMLMRRMAGRLPRSWEIDVEDLGNVHGKPKIQSCNACVSTSMALCVWPCNCYEPRSKVEPDLMWDRNLYARLDLADAWAFIGPINWYAPSSNLKLMFDRLVCMNGGNPRADLIDEKDPKLAMKLEKSPQWKDININHLEGRTAAFFLFGDKGGNEMDPTGRPRILRHKSWFDPAGWEWDDDRESYRPLVMQCRWSGIEVPNKLWTAVHSGVGLPYADNQQKDMAQERRVMKAFDAWVKRFAKHVAAKGKVEPGKYRAYGHKRGGPSRRK